MSREIVIIYIQPWEISSNPSLLEFDPIKSDLRLPS